MQTLRGYFPDLLPRIRRHVPTRPRHLREIRREAVYAKPETQSVVRGAVLATESPITRFDAYRSRSYDEVLLMKGCQWRAGRKQIPLIDGTLGNTVRGVFGSCRNLRVEGDELLADLHFATDPDAQIAAAKVLAGHFSDLRLNVQPLSIVRLEVGEQHKTRSGVIEGPADVVLQWMPLSASLEAFGPDPRAVAIR